MKQYKVLIAEDTKEARDMIFEGLNEYAKANGIEFIIDKTEKPEKALNKLNESRTANNYYNIFFCDIDFTEAGGKRDGGYDLIEKAFEVCPITQICTYSGQFRAKDLWPKYEELKNKGLIVNTMDKSHDEGGESEWLFGEIKKLVDKVEEENLIFDLWYNHNVLWEKIRKQKFGLEEIEKYAEIKSNFESIIFLLKKRKLFEADIVLFKIIIQLYHRSLEIFVSGDKSEEQIIQESEKNKEAVFNFVEDLIKNKNDRDFSDKKSFLRKIAAFSATEIYRFGHILNWYRNGCVHPNEKFTPQLINILYANLVLAVYILNDDLSEIKIDSIKNTIKTENDNFNFVAKRDINKLIQFIIDRK